MLLARASLGAAVSHAVTPDHSEQVFGSMGNVSVCSGTNPMSHCCHSTLSYEVHHQIHSILGLAGTHEDCGTLLLLVLVVALVDEHETCLMRHSHRTVDAEGSSVCQSSFHCIVPPKNTNAFSPAHVTSCLEAECVCSTLACSRN